MILRSFLFLLLIQSNLYGKEIIDVIIPAAKKDIKTLDYCIKGIKANCADIRYVFVISEAPFTSEAEWVDENEYPFSKKGVAFYLTAGKTSNHLHDRRTGWYYQQLLKLYAMFVIPGISSNILALDADTIFLREVSFFNHKGEALYNPGMEYHAPYFVHASKLIPGFRKKFPEYSGISHHMIFQKEPLEALFKVVEKHTQTCFWKAFCLNVDSDNLLDSGASEYEIYFNFVFSKPWKVNLRKFKWANKPAIHSDEIACKLFEQALHEGFHYISCHQYEGD